MMTIQILTRRTTSGCSSSRCVGAPVVGATTGPTAHLPILGKRPAGGIPVGTTIPVLSVPSTGVEGVAVAITANSHTGCLSVGFTQLAIARRHAKMGSTASGRYAFLLIHLVSFVFCLRIHLPRFLQSPTPITRTETFSQTLHRRLVIVVLVSIVTTVPKILWPLLRLQL